MSEHDPITDLENFGTGGVAVTPLPPAEVRRLGERRRTRRRNTRIAMVAAAAVVAVALPFALSLGGDPDASRRIAHRPKPTPTDVSKVITYPGVGVEVRSVADTAKLTGTSADFKTFIASVAAQAITDGNSCPGAAAVVTVQKYSTAGYALGGVNSCGGYEALWARGSAIDGAWGEGQATQDQWDCDALAYLRVPVSFTGPCTDEAGDFGTPGAGGAEPGMSRARLISLGLQVPSGPNPEGGDCVSVSYGSAVLPDRAVGVYDPRDGLVDVAMTASMKTAERVGLGTPRRRVIAAYPGGHSDGSGGWVVPRSHGTSFEIRFTGGRVASLSWQLVPKHCGVWLP